jgi:hypothetical protein
MSSAEIRLKDNFREKARVGGSTPSLATISFSNLAAQAKISHL